MQRASLDRDLPTPAVTQSDLRRKIALYNSDLPCEYTAKKLLRDLRRLAQTPLAAAA